MQICKKKKMKKKTGEHSVEWATKFRVMTETKYTSETARLETRLRD